jgi:hypothetical protein
MEPQLPGIHDEDLVRQAPYMRYLVGQRLEEIWNACQPHLDGTAARPDHRYVETSVRVLAHMSRLYRLDAPASPVLGETVPADAARMVEAGLRELESRLRPDPA